MAARDLEDKVCPRHPNSPAVARCFACFKPICRACLVVEDAHEFCSAECAQKHAQTDKVYGSFLEAEKRLRRRRLVRRTIGAVACLIIAYVAIMYWIRHPAQISAWLDVVIGLYTTIRETIAETIAGLTS